MVSYLAQIIFIYFKYKYTTLSLSKNYDYVVVVCRGWVIFKWWWRREDSYTPKCTENASRHLQCFENGATHIYTTRYKVFGGIKHYRYRASLHNKVIGKPLVSLGRYANTVKGATEDVAILLLRRTLSSTGKQIVDYNHHNVQLLETQLIHALECNVDLKIENSALVQEMKFLKEKLWWFNDNTWTKYIQRLSWCFLSVIMYVVDTIHTICLFPIWLS